MVVTVSEAGVLLRGVVGAGVGGVLRVELLLTDLNEHVENVGLILLINMDRISTLVTSLRETMRIGRYREEGISRANTSFESPPTPDPGQFVRSAGREE